jgi:hypothetical protein
MSGHDIKREWRLPHQKGRVLLNELRIDWRLPNQKGRVLLNELMMILLNDLIRQNI